MTTETQIRANRENAKHSTGPRTEAGKAASSQNARKHGFNSSRLVIPEKHRDEFDEHSQALHADLKPLDSLAEDLFHQLLHASWNIRRIELIQLETLSRGDPFRDELSHRELELLMRYHGHFHRVYQRVLKSFQQHQSSIAAPANGVKKKPANRAPARANGHAAHDAGVADAAWQSETPKVTQAKVATGPQSVS